MILDLIARLSEKREEFKDKQKVEDSAEFTGERSYKPFQINYKEKELYLPEPTDDILPLYLFIAVMAKLVDKDIQIYNLECPDALGVSGDDIARFVKSMNDAFGLLPGSTKKIELTTSMIAKIFIDYAVRRYKSAFFNLGRNEKVPTGKEILFQCAKIPILRGKESSLFGRSLPLLYSLLSRYLNFEICQKDNKISRDGMQYFIQAYIASTITKDTFKDALKENKLKLINFNEFNPILFSYESDYFDQTGIAEVLPDNYPAFFAKMQKAFDEGDYTVCTAVHKLKRDIGEYITDNGLSILYRRLKARNRIANLKEVQQRAKRDKVSAYSYPLEYYLQFTTADESKLWRPMALPLVSENYEERLEDTARFKNLYVVSRRRTREGGEIRDADLNKDRVRDYLQGRREIKYPIIQLNVEEKITPEYLERYNEHRESSLARLTIAADACLPAFRLLDSCSTEQVPKFNI
jgi:hypothetical protein